MQLMESWEDWTAAVENGDPVDAACMDFVKAVDSVPHERLLSKMRAQGIGARLLDWICVSLVGCFQRAMI